MSVSTLGLNRVLHVQVTQRKPLARVHTGPDEADVYLDSHGQVLPLSPYYTARVPIIHADDIEMCDVAFDLIQATHEDILWSAFIDQVEVNQMVQWTSFPDWEAPGFTWLHGKPGS